MYIQIGKVTFTVSSSDYKTLKRCKVLISSKRCKVLMLCPICVHHSVLCSELLSIPLKLFILLNQGVIYFPDSILKDK